MADHGLARRLDACAEDRDAIRPEPKAQVVAWRQGPVEQALVPGGTSPSPGRRDGQPLAGAHKERHVGPAPRVEPRAQRRIRLGVGICGDACPER